MPRNQPDCRAAGARAGAGDGVLGLQTRPLAEQPLHSCPLPFARPVTVWTRWGSAFVQGTLDGGAAAIRRNAWRSQNYEQLRAAGKPGTLAFIAAMRKLLEAAWKMATHQQTPGAGLSAS